MVDSTTMDAQARVGAGKGAARAVRRSGRVPAVIYGNKKDPALISLHPVELMKNLRSGHFYTSIYEFEVDGVKEEVLPRDVQFHPVTDEPLHVDFMRFGAKTKFAVDINVTFINEETSVGLKRGGVLNVVRHTVEFMCSPNNIPDEIIIDLAPFDIGDSIHISAVDLPTGIEATITDRDFTIATIQAPTVASEATDEEAEDVVDSAEGADGEEESED